jgi:hypothetical protein
VQTERRRSFVSSSNWEQTQLQEWAMESHLWEADRYGYKCKWCGYRSPEAVIDWPLCKKNPKIAKLIGEERKWKK